MFQGSGVTEIPANFIKAIVYSGESCCRGMFSSCTSLTTISENLFEHVVNPSTSQPINLSKLCFY